MYRIYMYRQTIQLNTRTMALESSNISLCLLQYHHIHYVIRFSGLIIGTETHQRKCWERSHGCLASTQNSIPRATFLWISSLPLTCPHLHPRTGTTIPSDVIVWSATPTTSISLKRHRPLTRCNDTATHKRIESCNRESSALSSLYQSVPPIGLGVTDAISAYSAEFNFTRKDICFTTFQSFIQCCRWMTFSLTIEHKDTWKLQGLYPLRACFFSRRF